MTPSCCCKLMHAPETLQLIVQNCLSQHMLIWAKLNNLNSARAFHQAVR